MIRLVPGVSTRVNDPSWLSGHASWIPEYWGVPSKTYAELVVSVCSVPCGSRMWVLVTWTIWVRATLPAPPAGVVTVTFQLIPFTVSFPNASMGGVEEQLDVQTCTVPVVEENDDVGLKTVNVACAVNGPDPSLRVTL